MKFKILFYFMALTGLFFSNNACADGISVSNASVQAMPPLQTTTAAYMTVTNNAEEKAVLTSVSSDIAGSAEIHQMSEGDGMMNMAMVPNISIPAQGSVTLKPGGYHIMLINLKKPVNAGDTVSLTLHFQDGSSVTVNATVKSQGQNDLSSMQGMQGMKM